MNESSFYPFINEWKPLVCVVGVPNHMTYADFCQFCGSFIQHMLEMRIVWYATGIYAYSCSQITIAITSAILMSSSFFMF